MDISQRVDLAIYNLIGESLIPVVNNQFLVENTYNYDVNLTGLPSGTYLCIYKLGDQVITKLFVLIQ